MSEIPQETWANNAVTRPCQDCGQRQMVRIVSDFERRGLETFLNTVWICDCGRCVRGEALTQQQYHGEYVLDLGALIAIAFSANVFINKAANQGALYQSLEAHVERWREAEKRARPRE